MRYVHVPFKKLAHEYPDTLLYCLFSLCYSALAVLTVRFFLILVFYCWSSWFAGMMWRAYWCERRHNIEHLKKVMAECVSDVLAVQEAERIVKDGF